jgi:hypothetical protein
MQKGKYDAVMVFLGFGCVCKQVNMILYFRNKMMLKIKECMNASERCFLWFKWDRGSWVHLPMIRPFCITILYHNLLLFIDIFHI